MNITIAALMLFCGFIGMYAHFRIAKRRGAVTGSFYDYMLADNPTASGITIGAFASAMSGLYGLGTFDQVSIEATIEALKNGVLYAPTASAIAISVTTGYMSDSTLNKGSSK
jgi:hypothetical protein